MISSIKGRDILVKCINLPSADAIYFTDSDEDLGDLICIHRWCMVFPLEESRQIIAGLNLVNAAIASIEGKAQGSNPDSPYNSLPDSNRIQSGASLLKLNIDKIKPTLEWLKTVELPKVKVLIPLKVYRGKIHGLFDNITEVLHWSFCKATRKHRQFILGLNSVTKRPLWNSGLYAIDNKAKDSSLSNSLWDLGIDTGVIKSLIDMPAKERPCLSSGDWSINGEQAVIYNNDLVGNIKSINPCVVCPNALRRTQGNCYFMSSQCKQLVLNNSEDSTSWTNIKKKS
jgi:hypothetical protein